LLNLSILHSHGFQRGPACTTEAFLIGVPFHGKTIRAGLRWQEMQRILLRRVRCDVSSIHFLYSNLLKTNPTFLKDRGQGLNISIADVHELLNAITSVRDGSISVEEAISAYDAEVVRRGAKEVKLSTENTFMVHDWNKIMASPLMQQGIKRG
jgi:hypothetical protein